MPLNDILNADIIDLNVQGQNKDEVLHYMANVLLKNGYINDVDVFVKDIYEREAEGPTGMGSHISIPHGKSNSVTRNGIMIGKTVNPIRWESSMSEDGFQDTHLIFLFCVSADAEFARNHMMLLSELAGKLGNDVRVTKLAGASTKEEIMNLLLCDDSELGEVDKVLEEEEIVDLDIDL
ncbi:MAG: PTS sugar transporter subunit IIA [Erysipelotrichaceae bacterium]|jgi:PTS system fructose-specific IIA component|nr:PTS sugar transporter subunit IIA [Erysipelotrichaceae bacterium]MBR2788447.1 PTS sugar transporter subunit IIA [Erysipelotrichaceae bacterium]